MKFYDSSALFYLFFLFLIRTSIQVHYVEVLQKRKTFPEKKLLLFQWCVYLSEIYLYFYSFAKVSRKYMHGLDPTKYVTLNMGSQVFSLVH